MHFCSIFFFLTLVPFLLAYNALSGRSSAAQKTLTLAYSYFFYGVWHIGFLLLLVLTTVMDYAVARGLTAYPEQKRNILALSIGVNLAVLFFFKYANFFAANVSLVAQLFGVEIAESFMEVALPVGISFYTFHSMNYTIDVYRGIIRSEKSLLDVALFIAFFPQLVAGPILRATDFLPQLRTPRDARSVDYEAAAFYILSGLVLKSVVADNVAPTVDFLFAHWADNSVAQNWLAACLFGAQIYCDFNGYSLIAIGLAQLLGYHIKPNFNAPYAANGFSDFWRRWHISLSSWFRDYLYIPLGGSRGSTLRTFANLMLTMSLCGLWHGASMQFLLWGFLHGLLLCLERLLNRFRPTDAEGGGWLGGLLAMLGTYAAVSALWIPFRAQSFEQCAAMLGGLFVTGVPSTFTHLRAICFLTVFVSAQWLLARMNVFEVMGYWPRLRHAMLVAFMAALYFGAGSKTQFIYFQF